MSEPIPIDELKRLMAETGEIEREVSVTLSDLLKWDIDNLNDYVSTQVTGSCALLEDISYQVFGYRGGNVIILKVKGRVDFSEVD